jgi:hypothetical protein
VRGLSRTRFVFVVPSRGRWFSPPAFLERELLFDRFSELRLGRRKSESVTPDG